MLTGEIAISSSLVASFFALPGYTAPTPIGDTTTMFVTSTRKAFQVFVSGGYIYINCADGVADGDEFEFTLVYLT